MAGASIDVVIVAWNVREQLQLCLDSLTPFVQASEVTVTVVDNNSADGTELMVRQSFPQVKFIPQQQNLGFAAASNLAAGRSTAPCIVFLNPDTLTPAGFAAEVLAFFNEHPRAGVVGGRILNRDGSLQPSVRGWPGIWSSALDSLKLLRRLPWLAPRYLKRSFDYQRAQTVEQVMGACLAIPRALWERLGGFDERFWMWFEEVDLCQRVWRAGYEVWYDPTWEVRHSGGASARQLTPLERHHLFTRSLLRYLEKYHYGAGVWLVWLTSRLGYVFAFLATYGRTAS